MIKNLDLIENNLSLEDSKQIFTSNTRAKTLMQGEVEIRDQFGRLLQKKHNMILLGGRRFTLEKLFNVTYPTTSRAKLNDVEVCKQTLVNHEEASGLSYPDSGDDNNRGPVRNKAVCLWGVGIGGSSMTFGDVNVPAEKEYNLYEMIPFRYLDTNKELNTEEKLKYFGHRTEHVGTHNYSAYYLKTFETEPTLVIKVGTQEYNLDINNDNLPTTWDSSIDIERDDVDIYIQLRLKLSVDDVREWFIEENGDIKQSRINELGTYFAVPKYNADGTVDDYLDIECFSKLCFNNEPLDDETKELDIIYKFYI